jgi:hypothetical protein
VSQFSKPSDYLPVADIEVRAVRPERGGFSLEGTGADRAEYRVDLELEVPVDQRTRTILGEMLAQSRFRIWRRAGQPMKPKTRAPNRPDRAPT